MIKPKLYGRLGNQCFQVSAAISHAKKMQTTWAIPRFTNDMSIWPNYFLRHVPRENISTFATRDYYNEPKHSYDALPNRYDLTIDGYFQSEKYFIDTKEEIGNALGFHCNKQDYIAVHVRRGDYVTQFSDKWPPLPISYYKEAISYIASYTGLGKFRIYSDDIQWCKQQFTPQMLGIDYMIFDDIFVVEYSAIKDPLTDMRDMYNAAGFIVANSTFSLFPALLRLDNPVTIAPAENKWFGPGNAHMQTEDLMPERFIKI